MYVHLKNKLLPNTTSPSANSDAGSEEAPISVKKPIKYGDSDLLKALKDYNIEPNEKVKRKIDYYYSPYNK